MKPLQLSWLSLRGPTLMASLLGVIALITLYFGVSSQRALKWVEHTAQVQGGFVGTFKSAFRYRAVKVASVGCNPRTSTRNDEPEQ